MVDTIPVQCLKRDKSIFMTHGDKKNFALAKEFIHDDVKVRNHDHVTGKYSAAAHTECNIKLIIQQMIPAFFQKFSNYDSHLITPALTLFLENMISLILHNMEKYLTMSFGHHALFKNSFMFINSGLAPLANNRKQSIPNKLY